MTQDYYGTKRVTAWPDIDIGNPQSEGVAAGEYIIREGYAVKYADGYTSWSPKAVFEAAYKPVDAMGFEGALAALKEGHRVARAGWDDLDDTDHLRMGGGDYGGGIMRVFTNPDAETPYTLEYGDDLLAEDWKIVDSQGGE